ncbi:MAG: hypothetical protein FJ290_10845 [Planctomycetes bacterium]|nr:hypothetical protein [Planctomycetota bacterium]
MSARVASRLVTALSVCAVVGCSAPAGKYFARRGADLADCVEASAGLGLGAYARVKATDYAVIGCGAALCGPLVGWRGRYVPPISEGVYGFPFGRNAEVEASFSAAFPPDYIVDTRGPCFTSRKYFRKPGPGGRIAEQFWFGVSLAALFHARLGFNPAELADFVVGWFGWDMWGDDDWPSEPKETPKEPPKGETKT